MTTNDVTLAMVGQQVKNTETNQIFEVFGVGLNDPRAYDYSSVHIALHCHLVTDGKVNKDTHYCFSDAIGMVEEQGEKVLGVLNNANNSLHKVELVKDDKVA